MYFNQVLLYQKAQGAVDLCDIELIRNKRHLAARVRIIMSLQSFKLLFQLHYNFSQRGFQTFNFKIVLYLFSSLGQHFLLCQTTIYLFFSLRAKKPSVSGT